MSSKETVIKELRELKTAFTTIAQQAAGESALRRYINKSADRADEYATYAANVGRAIEKFSTPSEFDDIEAILMLERLEDKFKTAALAQANVKSHVPFGFMVDQTPAAKLMEDYKFARKLDKIMHDIR